jgi:hypothetical protein
MVPYCNPFSVQAQAAQSFPPNDSIDTSMPSFMVYGILFPIAEINQSFVLFLASIVTDEGQTTRTYLEKGNEREVSL